MTRRFVRGYSEGVQFLKANKAAGIRAIQKYARIKDPEILEATYGEARAYIETVPYVTRKGMETIIAELLPTEPKAKTAKPDDFLDTRFVSQLEKEGFYKACGFKMRRCSARSLTSFEMTEDNADNKCICVISTLGRNPSLIGRVYEVNRR